MSYLGVHSTKASLPKKPKSVRWNLKLWSNNNKRRFKTKTMQYQFVTPLGLKWSKSQRSKNRFRLKISSIVKINKLIKKLKSRSKTKEWWHLIGRIWLAISFWLNFPWKSKISNNPRFERQKSRLKWVKRSAPSPRKRIDNALWLPDKTRSQKTRLNLMTIDFLWK